MLARILFALALSSAFTVPLTVSAQTTGLAGSYLAARHANFQSDFEAAADYYVRALARDPSNPNLMESAVASLIAVGRMDRALPIAQQLAANSPNSQVAALVLIAHNMNQGRYSEVRQDFEAGLSVGPLVDGLARAWSLVGSGEMSAALAAFDEVANQQGLAAFATYHKALALANVGDFEGAAEIFSGGQSAQMQSTRRGIVANALILSQLERYDDAIIAIRSGVAEGADPAMDALANAIQDNEPQPFTLVTSAGDGVAEVFLSVATALSGEATDALTLTYARIADFLRSDDTDTILLIADLLEQLEQFDLATKAYDRVPRNDALYHAAELGRAEALRRAGRTDAAVEALQQLAESHGDIDRVHQALGDVLRRLERYDEASQAYDRAIALHETPERRHWLLYFARGITHEREDRWPLAEADFRQALLLSPDQPQVLNYLGYSMVELRQNLDEALDLIERAVAARPDDGYITDSLGWVLYRLGRFEEAVGHMERAAELMPVDPIINDHLGDVYWVVGRYLEAQFQWRRALSFDPEEEDLDRIRRKLEVGLDVVLEEEKAEPLDVANDG